MSQKFITPGNLNPSDFDIGTLVPNQVSVTYNGQLLSDVLDDLFSQIALCCGSAATACNTLLFADNETKQFFTDEAISIGTPGQWQFEMAADASNGDNGSVQGDILDPAHATKADWYASFVAMVNSFTEWSMTLITDQPLTSNQKALYKIEYLGTGTALLRFKYGKPGNDGDYYELQIDAAGNVQSTRAEDNNGTVFGTYPWSNC